MMKIKLDSGAFMTEYAHAQDAGMDLRSPINAVVLPRKRSEKQEFTIATYQNAVPEKPKQPEE